MATTKIVDKDGIPHHIFSVLDGHGGGNCANSVITRLHKYLSLAIDGGQSDWTNAFAFPNDSLQGQNESQCLQKWIEYLNAKNVRGINEEIIMKCFEHIDASIVYEAERAMTQFNTCTVKQVEKDVLRDLTESDMYLDQVMSGVSGACASTVVIKEDEALIASVGDCGIIIGSYDDNKPDSVKGRLLIEPHTFMNEMERERVLSKHPEIERYDILYQQRLLGHLMPLRAFGDLQLKVGSKSLTGTFVPFFGDKFLLPGYSTPPYLTVTPTVKRVHIKKDDAFIVICSDGLMSDFDADDIARITQKFRLNNPATALIKHCLVRNPHKVDNEELANELSNTSPKISRDDISVIVIFLNGFNRTL